MIDLRVFYCRLAGRLQLFSKDIFLSQKHTKKRKFETRMKVRVIQTNKQTTTNTDNSTKTMPSLRDMPPLGSTTFLDLRDMPPLESPPASPPLAPAALPPLPNNLILKILGDLRKAVKDEHQQKLSKCFKEMNQKHRGTLHAWFEGDGEMPEDIEDAKKHAGFIVKDVWFLEENEAIRNAGWMWADIYETRLWPTEEDEWWNMDEGDRFTRDFYYQEQNPNSELEHPMWFNRPEGRVWLVDGRGNKTLEHPYRTY